MGEKTEDIARIHWINGGERGIRTPDRFNPMPVFKTGAFNHSAISPGFGVKRLLSQFINIWPNLARKFCIYLLSISHNSFCSIGIVFYEWFYISYKMLFFIVGWSLAIDPKAIARTLGHTEVFGKSYLCLVCTELFWKKSKECSPNTSLSLSIMPRSSLLERSMLFIFAPNTGSHCLPPCWI